MSRTYCSFFRARVSRILFDARRVAEPVRLDSDRTANFGYRKGSGSDESGHDP